MSDTPEEKPAGDAAPPVEGPAEEVFESQLDAINIKLQAFEGPLDLLVHLIKKNKMNVYDIQISVITRQYLEYLNLMQELNLDIASEFLVMSATLIHIKSKMLLPRPETAAGDPGEEEDPRDLLVRRLLEHQHFKAAAEMLHDKETLRSAQWARPDSRIEEIAGEDYEPEIEVDLFSLLSAFKQVLERARERPPVVLPPEEIPIELRIEQLLEQLSETDACGFEDLFGADATRADMIVTFLAMLEMIRLKLIRVFQQGGTGAIRVYKRARPTDAPHPIHDPEDEYKAHHPESGHQVPGSGTAHADAGTPDIVGPEADAEAPEAVNSQDENQAPEAIAPDTTSGEAPAVEPAVDPPAVADEFESAGDSQPAAVHDEPAGDQAAADEQLADAQTEDEQK